MVGWLKKKFTTPLMAEQHFGVSATPGVQLADSTPELSKLSSLFTHCSETSGLEVDENFLSYAIVAMKNLKDAGRSNIVYNLCKGLAIMRDDQSDTLFPRHRMPMGLCLWFFCGIRFVTGKWSVH